MRRPGRKAAFWLATALLGAAAMTVLGLRYEQLGDLARGLLGAGGVTAIGFGLFFGLSGVLAALGEARLRGGIGRLARWEVSAREWEAFRLFDARRGRADPALTNEFTPRRSGQGVEVVFGRRQVIVDGSYHRLSRWALPALGSVAWLQPEGAPECLEFEMVHPRSRYGGTISFRLRVPVARAARDEGIRVFHHFHSRIPRPREGLAFRRPWLVIGWGLGIMGAALILAGIGWLMRLAGDTGETPAVLMLLGIIAAIGAAVFTAIIAIVALPGRRAR
ncbi:hypothetical protein DFH01_00345 [Falsiroseomonas bella]|uniref:Uncharacterized protein n=1 Tax=Falsiroseomonas bella TaxID=2184016 RepID=A0A317FG85_9PROT|nr:hypothetical protein [Falsiroseomonas bella]PWS37805.1 hypothetical protein DFH01_00345 [Falsiroseomonas bella]